MPSSSGTGDRSRLIKRIEGPNKWNKARRRKVKAAAWAIGTAVLVAVITDALTGIGTAGLRAIWARVTNAEPVVVHSEVFLHECHAWVIPGGGPGHQPMPREVTQSEENYRSWIREHDAVQGHATTVGLTIRGGSSNAVVLQELRVRVLERRKPAQGTEVSKRCEGGDGVDPRLYQVDLDADHPVPRPVRAESADEEAPVTFPYRVTHRDPEVIRVEASTANCYCRWQLELVYVDGEQERVKVIDDNGRPFRTTALPATPSGRG
ncbi:MAG: hypothetical protein GEV03_27050 [Streptosporangiales bacterium]|nr:hypothetical protein [Streptosporangiales bacterium]